MADVLLSPVVDRIFGLIEEQAVYHVNLVRGAEKEVRSIASELNTIRNVLNDAENRRFGDTNIDSWLWKLRQISYEVEDILDDWKHAILKLEKEKQTPKQKVCSFIPSSSCFCFKKAVVRHEIASKILNVKAKLDEILEEKKKYDFKISEPTPAPQRDQSTSFIDLGEVQGRVDDGEILVNKLIGNGGSQDELGVQVVSIVGVGGLGKTTLAQLVYNNSRVKESFKLKIWICVSDPFDLNVIAKDILERISEGSSGGAAQLDDLFTRIKNNISSKKFLLVLDDVWTEDCEKWESLKNGLGCGGAGSKILVTTRSDKVAEAIGQSEIFRPELLSAEDCWLVLRGISLSESKWAEYEDIGMSIAQKCCGLPLAAKTLGGLLRSKRSLRDWQKVLNSEMWEMPNVEDKVFRSLLMSYNELSPREKQCFSYCGVFPKNSKINVKALIGYWMALGYLGSNRNEDMELNGKECFDVLSMRSLFQDFEKNDLDEIRSCKMHDIVHDFAQYLRKRGRVEAAELNKSTRCQVCDPSHVTNVNEFCTLDYQEISPPNLCNCLVRVRVLSLSIGLQSVPQGIDYLIHMRWLNMWGNKLSTEDLKIIFQLFFLQTLYLGNCSLEEIPKEIENLSDLRHLNLSHNELKELPSEIENLEQLRHLDLSRNWSLKELPCEIGKLIHMQTLKLSDCGNLCRFPDALAQLTNLRKLTGFGGGSGRSKLGLLKNLNQLGGRVVLSFKLDEDLKGVVGDAREAELSNKVHIQHLVLQFENEMDEEEESSRMDVINALEPSRMDVINALEPNHNLRQLTMRDYKGSKHPLWIDSRLNQLRKVNLFDCQLTSLPSLGKLSCLEEINIVSNNVLEFVGREFLGITTDTNFVAFPKLKSLTFASCSKWKEWEDITAEEEESASFQVMPCLKELEISHCWNLTPPHRLLRKVFSLEGLEAFLSNQYAQRWFRVKIPLSK